MVKNGKKALENLSVNNVPGGFTPQSPWHPPFDVRRNGHEREFAPEP